MRDWWYALRCLLRLHRWGSSKITTQRMDRAAFKRVVVQKTCDECLATRIEGVLTDWVGDHRGATRAEKRRMGRRLDARRR